MHASILRRKQFERRKDYTYPKLLAAAPPSLQVTMMVEDWKASSAELRSLLQ